MRGIVLSTPDTFKSREIGGLVADANCLDCYSVQFLKSWRFDRYATIKKPDPRLHSTLIILVALFDP